MNEIAQKTVLISGGAGSMGQLVSDYISSRNDFIMTAIHDPNYDGQEYKIYKDLTNIAEDIVVEFSPASVINKNIEKLLDSNADLIIGSSGVSAEMLSKLKKTIDRKIIVIPNFSIGAAYQKLFAAALSENFDSVNITEKHHGKKQDAPSGTAIDLANSLPSEFSIVTNDSPIPPPPLPPLPLPLPLLPLPPLPLEFPFPLLDPFFFSSSSSCSRYPLLPIWYPCGIFLHFLSV